VDIGRSGTGVMTQTDGTNTVSEAVQLGGLAGSTGEYRISGGQLTCGELLIGGEGAGLLAIDDPAAEVTLTGRLQLNATGALSAVTGSRIRMTGTAVDNLATWSADWRDTANLTLVVTGGSDPCEIETAGEDRGATAEGWVDNFALAGLTIGGEAPGVVTLADRFDNQPGSTDPDALYVETLSLLAGSRVMVNDLHLYYRNGGEPKRLIYGDANLDGAVDVFDLAQLGSNYGRYDCTWAEGDFLGDGTVDVFDLALLADNYRTSTGGSIPVPVPPVAVLLPAGAAALIARRRRPGGNPE
jgi:hypothetical protein